MKNNTNPKALNLDAVRNSKSRVTVGFKCEPSLKLSLAEAAEEEGLTLSEFVEAVLLNYENNYQRLEKLTETINSQNKIIGFYENDILKKLFVRHKNQVVEYINGEQQKVNAKISDLKDVYTVIINSFKTQR